MFFSWGCSGPKGWIPAAFRRRAIQVLEKNDVKCERRGETARYKTRRRSQGTRNYILPAQDRGERLEMTARPSRLCCVANKMQLMKVWRRRWDPACSPPARFPALCSFRAEVLCLTLLGLETNQTRLRKRITGAHWLCGCLAPGPIDLADVFRPNPGLDHRFLHVCTP